MWYSTEIRNNRIYPGGWQVPGRLPALSSRWVGGEASSQSNELTRRPPELVHHFRLYGEFTSAQERCLTLKSWYGLAISLAYPSGEEGGNLLVQIFSTCRHGLTGGVGWGPVQHPMGQPNNAGAGALALLPGVNAAQRTLLRYGIQQRRPLLFADAPTTFNPKYTLDRAEN